MDERGELHEGLDTFLGHLFGLVATDELNLVADVEMSFTQVRALHLLAAADEPQPLHRIAERLGLSLTATGRNIDRLVRLGSVDRRENPVDRRSRLVSITPHGLDVIEQHRAPRRRALHAFVAGLPDDSVRAFLDALRPLMADDHFGPGQPAVPSQLSPTDHEENHVPHGG
ncbi:MarR family transcriptional regulator [Streptomyces sp. Z26]|uniref:MarR family winged helix-turn-helix transcriptional regulator n=1 Tax=Streptomyces TaxID=1883 RepID=UPI000EF16FD0|nr:MarR family transcriptional regulator [Streptomyces sp. Z26]RLL70009.1 MarR family transcriptional regulator [Streptomyces sp. Z26]